MLFVRSAPGVRAISSRLINVVGVMLSTFAADEFVSTNTDCCTDATDSSKCATGEVFETTVMVCFCVSKPDELTVTK
jgi:hypothetical protein